MNILRKTALGVCASLLLSTLFGFGLSYGLYHTFKGPDTIKTAFRESGVYKSLTDKLLEQIQKNEESAGNSTVTSNPEVQKIIGNSVPSTLLQQQTEQALDSTYGWIQGKDSKLQFSFDLNSAKQTIADNVAKYAEQQAATLPACAPRTAPDTSDPFNLTCLPAGVSAAQVGEQAKNKILSDDFLKNATVTQNDLKSSNGKTPEQQLRAAPQTYRRTKQAIYGTGLLALLMMVAVILLGATWRAGAKRVAVAFIVAGALSAALSLLTAWVMNRLLEYAKDPLQQSMGKVLQHLTGDFRDWWFWYGVVLAAAGIIMLIVLRLIRPNAPVVAPRPEGPVGEAMPPGEALAQTTSTEKPKPVKKVVQ